jgi:hypothetical protein
MLFSFASSIKDASRLNLKTVSHICDNYFEQNKKAAQWFVSPTLACCFMRLRKGLLYDFLPAFEEV